MYLASISIGKNHNYDIGQVSYNIKINDLTGDGILSYFVITSFKDINSLDVLNTKTSQVTSFFLKFHNYNIPMITYHFLKNKITRGILILRKLK